MGVSWLGCFFPGDWKGYSLPTMLLRSIDSQTNHHPDFQEEVLWLTTNQDCLMLTSILPCSILDGVRGNYTLRSIPSTQLDGWKAKIRNKEKHNERYTSSLRKKRRLLWLHGMLCNMSEISHINGWGRRRVWLSTNRWEDLYKMLPMPECVSIQRGKETKQPNLISINQPQKKGWIHAQFL